MNAAPQEFWSWFKEHNARYLFLNEVEQQLQQAFFDELRIKLQEVNPNLYFLIGGHPEEETELIITAEGNAEYFDDAEALVNAAPPVERWKFIALKPAMGEDFSIEFEGVKFDSTEAWFYILEVDDAPEKTAIEVCFPGYSEDKEKIFLGGAILLLDIILGEKSATLDIYHVQVGELSESPAEDGMIPLKEIGRFIEWKKAQL